jgi:hypothetical protein
MCIAWVRICVSEGVYCVDVFCVSVYCVSVWVCVGVHCVNVYCVSVYCVNVYHHVHHHSHILPTLPYVCAEECYLSPQC